MRTLILASAIAFAVVGCNSTCSTPSVSSQIVGTLVVGAVGASCAMIKESARPDTINGLNALIKLLNDNPAHAVAEMNTMCSPEELNAGVCADAANPLNQNEGAAWIWYAIQSQIGTQWTAYGAGLLRQATVACIQAIS